MQPENLGQRLRELRLQAGLGPIKAACEKLGVSHTSLGMYERGETLPDVDFLAVFADRTGADFNELLQLRLASGKTEEAKRLAVRRDQDDGKDTSNLDQELQQLEDALHNEPTVPVPADQANTRLRRTFDRLHAIATDPNASDAQRARADMMLEIGFGDSDAEDRAQKNEQRVFAKFRRISAEIDEAVELVGYDPPPIVKEALKTAMLSYGLTTEGVIFLLRILRTQQIT